MPKMPSFVLGSMTQFIAEKKLHNLAQIDYSILHIYYIKNF
jgi:hypothetical protein